MPLNVVGSRLVSDGGKVELAILGVGLGDKDIAGIQKGTRYFLDNCWQRFEFGDQDVILVIAAVEGEEELRDFTEWIKETYPPDHATIEKARAEWQNSTEVIPISLPPRPIAPLSGDGDTPETVLQSVLDTKGELRGVVVIAEWADRSQEVCWSDMSLSELCKAWLLLGEEIGVRTAEAHIT